MRKIIIKASPLKFISLIKSSFIYPFCSLFLLLGCLDSGGPSGHVDTISLETKSNHIKALFFGTGPYASVLSGDNGCPSSSSRWQAFPAGSAVEVIIPANVSSEGEVFVLEEVNKLNVAFAGYMTINVVVSSHTKIPKATTNQLTINLLNTAEMKKICSSSGGGCIKTKFKGNNYELIKGDSYYPINLGIFDIHEIGHGIGLCHVDSEVFPEGTMASSGGVDIRSFSDSELDAINTVFTSGLVVGATEQDFWDAGLIP